MTRFKELRRIEAAIEQRSEAELRWALGYCEMRLRIGKLKTNQKTWRNRVEKIRAVLSELESRSN